MARVLLSGYYGFGNVGDEAILASTVESLRAKDPAIEISVLSANPEETAKTYGVVAYGRMSPRDVVRGVLAADLVVFGGGSLLQDDTSFRSLLYYLSIIFASRVFRKPVAVYANGIGPIRSWIGRLLTRLALSSTKRITVRDPESEKLLKRIGVRRPVRVTADPAFLLTPCPNDRRDELLASAGIPRDKPLVWLALRPGKAPESFYKSFVPVVGLLRAKGFEPCFLVMQEQDTELVPLVNRWLSEAGREQSRSVAGVNPREALALLEKSAFCVGMRLHTLILAARAAVPFIGVEIDPKLGAFCRAAGCPVIPNPASHKNTDLVLELERFIDIREQLRRGLTEKLPIFTSLAKDNVDMILAALRGASAE
ncbi:MAG: polysaccharide pyruvyl transferase CsaB [Bacillota bacterium]